MAETPQQEIDRLVAVAVRREARHREELEALGVPLGPDGRPDCGYCAERLKVNVGLAEENRQLRTGRLGRQIERASANVRASDAYKHRPEARPEGLLLAPNEAFLLAAHPMAGHPARDDNREAVEAVIAKVHAFVDNYVQNQEIGENG